MSDADRRPDERTGLVVLDEDECWQRLADEEVGRLAVTVGTHPDIFPVNYRVHEGAIAIRTEAGTKLAAAVLNRSVAFEIDGVDHERRTGWSVVVAGTAREPQRLAEVVALDDLDLDLWVATPKSRWLLIEPEHVTGRALVSPAPLTPH